jgi:hypothetical protein
MPDQKLTLSAQTDELATRLDALIVEDTDAAVLVPRVTLEEVAGKLRAVSKVIDTAAQHTIHFAATTDERTVVHQIMDTQLDEDTMNAARSIVDAALEDDDWVIVNLVRQMPPHASQQMLLWYLLQSLKGQRLLGDPAKQQQAVVGAHCTVCDTDWDAEHLRDAQAHSSDENHHVLPILGTV